VEGGRGHLAYLTNLLSSVASAKKLLGSSRLWSRGGDEQNPPKREKKERRGQDSPGKVLLADSHEAPTLKHTIIFSNRGAIVIATKKKVLKQRKETIAKPTEKISDNIIENKQPFLQLSRRHYLGKNIRISSREELPGGKKKREGGKKELGGPISTRKKFLL